MRQQFWAYFSLQLMRLIDSCSVLIRSRWNVKCRARDRQSKTALTTSINKDDDCYQICAFVERKHKLLLHEVYFAGNNNLMPAKEALTSKRSSVIISSGLESYRPDN